MIESLLVRVADGEHQLCQQTVERLNELHQEICTSPGFPVFAMLRYKRHCREFTRLSEGEFAGKIPDFFADDYLELRFASDPSDFGVVLALAVKSWESGRTIRARQLFSRVARSRFREHKLAAYYLARYFEAPDQPGMGIAAASNTGT
jgi:hypothetical protein